MMTEQIFSNNFWGLKDDGFHVLTAKMNSTKKTFDEIKSFYNVRASLHEEFGRKLMKHAKVGMGREETGTLQALLSSAHKEMEWTAQAHLNLAQKLKMRLEVDLDNFILAQKDKRKLAHTNVEKAHRYKQSNEAYLSKVKEKYESDCAKLITLQTQVSSATGREAERIKQRIDRTQHEIKIQEQEYKNACIKVADATEAWNRTWKITCDTYQGMEKKRLEFLHHSFSMYVNVLSTATSQDQESYERFWKSLDQYDSVGDIQLFISEKGTGPKIPEPEIFVDYMDDPTKTFQQHTIANFPCPPELLSTHSTPVDTHPKPELTVRNPGNSNNTISNSASSPITPVQQKMEQKVEESTLLKRVKSVVVPNSPVTTLTDPPTPSKSNTEKRRSTVRNVIKPLPSISTPVIQQKKHQRKPSIRENQQSGITSQPPPVLVVPEISSSSTTSASEEGEEEDSSTGSITKKRSNGKNKKEEEGDITIDPRAKVVFAIGNNMFDLGHLDLEEKDKHESTSNRRLTSSATRRRQPSADIEAACNFSYQSLLEELGVFDKKSDDDKNNKKDSEIEEKAAPTDNRRLSSRIASQRGKRMSVRQKRPSQQQQTHPQPQPQNQQPQQPQQQPQPAINDYQTPYGSITNVPVINNNALQQQQPQVQQDMYNINNDPYRQQQQQQQQAHIPSIPHQQQYYNQYPTQGAAQAPNGMMQHNYHTVVNSTYNPPAFTTQHGHKPTLFWALALGDWYSGKPEELQYSRGTWLAVTETRSDGWYYATKYDARLNTLSNEMGYVAQNYVQVHHS